MSGRNKNTEDLWTRPGDPCLHRLTWNWVPRCPQPVPEAPEAGTPKLVDGGPGFVTHHLHWLTSNWVSRCTQPVPEALKAGTANLMDGGPGFVTHHLHWLV